MDHMATFMWKVQSYEPTDQYNGTVGFSLFQFIVLVIPACKLPDQNHGSHSIISNCNNKNLRSTKRQTK